MPQQHILPAAPRGGLSLPDKLSDRTDAQTSPSSAQDLQRAVQFDAILPVWIEPVWTAAGVSATLGQQPQQKYC